MTESDLRSTLNLPKTDFPMKANLPQAEPQRLEQWKAEDLYGQIRGRAEGRPSFVLHDGPPYANGHIHLGTALNKILKDVVVRSRSMHGLRRALPARAGTATACPIELKVDKDLGREEARDVAGRVPQGLPGLRREVRGHPARRVRAARASSGSGSDPYLTMAPVLPGGDRPRSSRSSRRRASSTRPRSRCTGASRAAPRSPRPRSSTTRTT